MLAKSKKHSDTSPVCQRHRIAVFSCFILPGLPSQALARQLSQRESQEPTGTPLPLTLGEVARRSRDGEGKDADKKQKTQRYKPCLSETSYRCAFVFYFTGLALSGADAPALPKGAPRTYRHALASPFGGGGIAEQ